MRHAIPGAAVAVWLLLAGCGSGAAPHPATAASRPPPPAASAAPGAAFCASLRASHAPQVTYASEVERQVGLAGNGSVTPEAIQAARTIVALWITISCPQYGWLTKGG